MSKKQSKRNRYTSHYSAHRAQILQNNGYVLNEQGKLVHRVVCRQAHGPFPSNWVVHHIDENKSNNVPENLIAMPRRFHDKIHTEMRDGRYRYTRPQLEAMLKGYKNLDMNKNLKIEIHVTICYDQIVKTEPVVSVNIQRSGSSLYR